GHPAEGLVEGLEVALVDVGGGAGVDAGVTPDVVGGEHDDRAAGRDKLENGDGLQPGHAGEAEVEDDDVGLAHLGEGDGLGGEGRLPDRLEPRLDEEGPDRFAHHRVVVAYKGAQGGHTRGSVGRAEDLSDSHQV